MAGSSSDRCGTAEHVAYEAPQIERRTEIGPTLIGSQLSSNQDT